MVPIFLGGLLNHLVARKHPNAISESEKDRIHQPGTLFSAGLITGEALTGIILAIPIVVSGRADVLALPTSLPFGQIVGLIVLAVVAATGFPTGPTPTHP